MRLSGTLWGRSAAAAFAVVSILLAIKSPNAQEKFGLDIGTDTRSLIGDVSTREVQRALIWTGHLDTMLTGTVGRRTRQAISKWRVAHGLEPGSSLNDREKHVLIAQAAIEALMDQNAPDRLSS